MKIIKLKSENVKKLTTVEIEPKDNTVIISGKNGQGKTSVLDSILFALAGKKAIDVKPIKHGEHRAEINLDLGDYKVKRIFEGESTRLEVYNSENVPCAGPQALLDKICGKIAFDPLQFTHLDSKAQLQMFKDLIGIDFSDLDKERNEAYEERTIIKRTVRDLQGELKFEPEDGLVEVSVAELSAQLTDLLGQKQKYVDLKSDITMAENSLEGLYEQMKELKQRIRAKEDELETKNELLIKTHKVSDESIEKIRGKIASAEDTNEKVRTNNKMIEIKKNLESKQRIVDELTETIKGVDQKKKEIMSEAKLPIAGLSMNEDGVLFNEIPFAQINDAEKMKVSIAIAMAMNPELRVIRITNGSLLDSDNMKIVKEMAKEKDYQIWIEKVDDSGQVGIVIEDGSIKAVHE